MSRLVTPGGAYPIEAVRFINCRPKHRPNTTCAPVGTTLYRVSLSQPTEQYHEVRFASKHGCLSYHAFIPIFTITKIHDNVPLTL